MCIRDRRNAALDELLAETELLDGLITDLSVSQADAAALVEALPEDLDPARRAVVEAACSLVGKVNYWWGGKSRTMGWDDRWGSLRKVTAGGSVTSGQYRPYGMDCSGFVDWVFYNATDGEYVIGHGGGAAAQHSYCAVSYTHLDVYKRQVQGRLGGHHRQRGQLHLLGRK